MYITLEADYAVRIVESLAESGTRVDAKTLSANTGVSLRFALKILRKLVAQGVVRSFKGTQGGYELERAPEEITLGEVIETVDGPVVFSRCVGAENFVCSRGEDAVGLCKFNRTYADLAKTIRDRLYSVTFADT